MIAADRNAGWMNLRVARIGKKRAFLVSAPRRRDIATLGIRGEEENVSVATSRQHDGVACVRADFAADEVAHHNTLRVPVNHHQVQHLSARKHLHITEADLPTERLIRSEEELLASLPARVERT